MNEISAFFYKIHKKIYRKIINNTKFQNNITNGFHKLYYHFHKRTWSNTFWLNNPVKKCPLDLWIYQEIIFETRPDVIIETGTALGGSALFLASICDLLKNGKVITIDIEANNTRPLHQRITYLRGSSTSKEILEKVREMTADAKKIMVILDSDHTKEHVLEELRAYHKFVPIGSYVIVEDTDIGGHPVRPDLSEGPMEAVEEFLKENEEFIIDKDREKFYLTFNPNGYLKRIGQPV